MLNDLQQREVFHLVFLREFVRRVKPGTYAIKGGVNLRLFYDSARYSEDMDLDITGIEVFKLKELVAAILTSPALAFALRTHNIDRIVPPNIAAAKQTDTVQRFKTHLINSAGEDLFTKIEFSRRGLGHGIVTTPVSDAILRSYRQPQLILSHYSADEAIRQKIEALSGRRATQARDVFDIFILSSQVDPARLAQIQTAIPRTRIKAAESALFSLTFENFRDTVCAFLNDADLSVYSNPHVWDEMQLKVDGIIGGRNR